MRVVWSKGGHADVATASGDRLTVRSSIASAPGSRLEGTIESGALIRLKVARCKRDDATGEFVIEGRLLDASRALRDELSRA